MFKTLHFPEYTDLRIIALGLNVAFFKNEDLKCLWLFFCF